MSACLAPRLFVGTLLLVPAIAFALAGCQSATTSTGPSPAKCQIVITPPGAFGAAGGPGNFTVIAAPECAWSASTRDGWISSLAPTSGQGGAEVRFLVAPNQSSRARQGEIALGEVVAPIGQSAASCAFALAPRSQTVASSGGTGTVTVTTLTDCDWSATHGVPWLSITSGTSGTGSGTVTFSADANTGAARAGTLNIAGQTFTVTQEAPGAPQAQCVYSIQPATHAAAAGGGGADVAVTAPALCSWTAASNESWLTIVSAAMGAGNGAVAFNVAANPATPRTGTLSIAGQTFTVTQAGSCTASLTPASASIGAAGGAGPAVTLSTGAGCAWTAIASAPWLTITSAPSGTGSATVAFTAAANSGSARTGTLNIAGQTFTVNQAAAPVAACTFTINRDQESFDEDGGTSRTVRVTTAAGCSWTAVSNDPWITVLTGASGTGSANVTFLVARNGDDDREGTLTIAGHTFRVTQEGD